MFRTIRFRNLVGGPHHLVTVANDEGTERNRMQVISFVQRMAGDFAQQEIRARYENDDLQMIQGFTAMQPVDVYEAWRTNLPQHQQQYQQQQQQQQHVFAQPASSGLPPQTYASLQPMQPMQPTQASYATFAVNTNGNAMPDQSQHGYYTPNTGSGGGWQ
jgi:hypothetical protein